MVSWSNVIFGVVTSKQPSTDDLAVFDLQRWLYLSKEGHRFMEMLTVGDVACTLCKQKQTSAGSALCATNSDKKTSKPLSGPAFYNKQG